MKSEDPTVTDSTSKDAPQNISPVLVRRLDSVGDRKTQAANVVGDNAEGNVHLTLFARIIRRKRAGVFLPAEFFQFTKDGTENIGLVIGDSSGEILEIVRALNHRGNAFEAHACVHMLGRKRLIFPFDRKVSN